MVNIQGITLNNWYECTQIKITEDQKKIFSFPVVYWIAECKYRKDFQELAIYNDETLVGFAVLGKDPDTQQFWIVSVMIDKRYQNRGIGQEAIQQLVNYLSQNYNCKKIYIGHKPNNVVAAHVYEKLGFEDTKQIEDGEVIRCLSL